MPHSLVIWLLILSAGLGFGALAYIWRKLTGG